MSFKLSYTHWAIVAAFVASLSTQIGSLESWASLRSPVVIGAVLAQIASLIAALYAHPPGVEPGVNPPPPQPLRRP